MAHYANRSSTKRLRKSSSIARACMQALEGRTYFGAGHLQGTNSMPYCPQCSATGNPVTFINGAPLINSTDLRSNAFGHSFGQTRSWVGVQNASLNGNGWMIGDMPYLNVLKSTTGGHDALLQVIQSAGKGAIQFAGNLAFSARGGHHNSLIYEKPYTSAGVDYPGMFRMTDEGGNTWSFFDVPRGGTSSSPGNITSGEGYPHKVTDQFADDHYQFGAFAGYVDAEGSYSVTTIYASDTGLLTDVIRTDGSGVFERLHYDYKQLTFASSAYVPMTNDTTVTEMLVSDVSLQRGSSGAGPWTTIRTASYDYYDPGDVNTADDKYGRLGDLKFATISEPARSGSQAISSWINDGNTVTATITGHTFADGDLITIKNASPRMYNGTFRVTGHATNTVTFDLEEEPSGSVTSSGTAFHHATVDQKYYRYNKLYTYNPYGGTSSTSKLEKMSMLRRTVDTITHVGTLATATTVLSHEFVAGDWVQISGAGEGMEDYEGYFEIDDILSSTQFTYHTIYEPLDDSEGATADVYVDNSGGIDHTFHRVHRNDPELADNAVMSGLATVVEGTALARLAGYDASYETTADLSDYANNSFVYERYSSDSMEVTAIASSRYRVIQEIAAGSGCSSCSGGFGTSKLEFKSADELGHDSLADPYDELPGQGYNAWVMRTKEYLPDTTTGTWADNDYNLVYTNERGDIMLKVQVDAKGSESADDDARYPTYYHYNENGYRDYVVHPSALTAFSTSWESNGDLVKWEQTGSKVKEDAGFVEHFAYATTTTATIGSDGDVEGYLISYSVQNGHTDSSVDNVVSSQTYIKHALKRNLSAAQLTGSGLTATVTWANHHFAAGDHIVVQGATQTAFNGPFTISSSGLTGDTFTYVMGTSITATAAGTISVINEDRSVYNIASQSEYFDVTGSEANEEIVTTYDYTWQVAGQTETNRVQTRTETRPHVYKNGPGTSVTLTVSTVYDKQGRPIWTKDEQGYLRYTAYGVDGGAITSIVDVDTSRDTNNDGDDDEAVGGETFRNLPFIPGSTVTHWNSPAQGGLHLATKREFDSMGRTTKLTDPKGNVTYTVYNDANHEWRRYAGWNGTSAIAPIEVHREYRPGPGADPEESQVYSEILTSSATPTVDGGVPTGEEAINEFNIISLSRSLTNDAGQTVEQDKYFSLAGVTYSTTLAVLGTASDESQTGNFHRTLFAYGANGKLKQMEKPNGTITRTVYDGLGRVASTWVGTDDEPTSGYWSPGNRSGTNLTLVSANEYDAGGIGEGNLTAITNYPGGVAAPQITRQWFDWRNRLIIQKQGSDASGPAGTRRPTTYYTYDNAGHVLSTEQFDGTTGDNIPSSPSVNNASFETTSAGANPWPDWLLGPNTSITSYLGETAAKIEGAGYFEQAYEASSFTNAYLIVKATQISTASKATVRIFVDGGEFASFTPDTDDWSDLNLETSQFSLPDGNHTIGIVASGGSGVYVDFVEVFDATNLQDSDFDSPITTDKWRSTAGAGVASSSAAPSGGKVAYLSPDEWIAQVIPSWSAGDYQISFQAAQASTSSSATFEVWFDDTRIDTVTPLGTTYQSFKTPVFSASSGTHRLRFEGVGTGSAVARIDAVAVVGVEAWRSTIESGVPDSPEEENVPLTGKSSMSYDELGRVYRSEVFSVDPSDGSLDGSLVTKTWYDARGNVIKTSSPGGLVTKQKYDGVGRVTATYQTSGDGIGDSIYGNADDVVGDEVLEQTEYTYDANGNVTFTANRQRAHNATLTGDLADEIRPARVVGRALFYNNSLFDEFNAGSDDAAIDTSITALLPGGTNPSDAISSYAKGINGIIIDVADLPATSLSSSDFTFKTGNDNSFGGWTTVSATPTITIRPGEGSGGSDRIVVTWADNDIQNTWLQVTLKSNANTGISHEDKFYFGNLIADTNKDGAVDSDDLTALESSFGDELNVYNGYTESSPFGVYEGAPYDASGTVTQSYVGGAGIVPSSAHDFFAYGDLIILPDGATDHLSSEGGGSGWSEWKFWLGDDGNATYEYNASGVLSRSGVNGPAEGDITGDGNIDYLDTGAYETSVSNTVSLTLIDPDEFVPPDRTIRSNYSERYYDAANRLTDSVNLGNNGGIDKIGPDASAPARSDTALRSSVGYQSNLLQGIQLLGDPTGGTFTLTFNGQTTSSIAYNASAATVESALIALSNVGPSDVAVTNGGSSSTYIVEFKGAFSAASAGPLSATSSLTGDSSPAIGFSRPTKMTDAGGKVSVTDTDLLGRTTRTIANFVNGSPSNADDQTTEYIYTGNGDVLTMTALLPSNAFQETKYIYGLTRMARKMVWDDPTNTATVTLRRHGFKVGDVVLISGANQNEFNQLFTISAVTTDTFSFALATATVATATGQIEIQQMVSSLSWHDPSNVATLTLSNHGFKVGQSIEISGSTESAFNGIWKIATVPTADSFTVTVVGSSLGSAGSSIVARPANDLWSNDTLIAVRYPDKSTGAASAAEQETFTFDALGQRKTYADRNGTVHEYQYNVVGQLISDTAATLGSGVDDDIQRIDYSYDAAGRPFEISSYHNIAGTGTPENEIRRTYNGFGQLAREYQAIIGDVDTGATPYVEYIYSETESGAVNHSRLKRIKYPNGRIVRYEYTGSGYVVGADVNDSISRLSFIADDSSGSVGTALEYYEYLGLDTVVNRIHPEPNVHQTKTRRVNEQNNTESGDQYIGLDRFGRVVDQRTVHNVYTDLDRYTYTYDENGNVDSKVNTLHTAYNEGYTYDDLNRLTALDAPTDKTWTLDALGNWDSVGGGLMQDRTHNAQNQITGGVGTTPDYDDNGNMIVNQEDYTLKYDAWNRLVEVKDGGSTLATYVYDGAGRRIQQGTTKLYYSDQWQVLEERNGSNAVTTQYVWSPVYVDAMILRDRDGNNDGDVLDAPGDERLYVIQDANFNVTGLVDDDGDVVERYRYDPYGSVTILDDDWDPDSGQISDVGWIYLHQGGRYDAEVNLYSFRHRDYDATLGRWLQADGKPYVDGLNLYAYEKAAPLTALDPEGFEPSFGGGSIRITVPKLPPPLLPVQPPPPPSNQFIGVRISTRLTWHCVFVPVVHAWIETVNVDGTRHTISGYQTFASQHTIVDTMIDKEGDYSDFDSRVEDYVELPVPSGMTLSDYIDRLITVARAEPPAPYSAFGANCTSRSLNIVQKAGGTVPYFNPRYFDGFPTDNSGPYLFPIEGGL